MMSSVPTISTAQPGAERAPDDVSIIVAGQQIGGWEDLEVTLRCEAFPNSFSISMSAPLSMPLVKAGDACVVMIGDDVVITGYVDRAGEAEDAQAHRWHLTGRGTTQDLVDCSAEWPSGQIINGDALQIATKLAEPYDITVQLGSGAFPGPKLPGWLLNYGETGAEIIQRLARNAGLLAYEDARGRLILGNVGADQAASGVVRGTNVQSWSVEASMDARFSDYVCASMPADAAIEVIGPGDIFYHHEPDANVPRHRQLDFVIETAASDKNPGDFTKRRCLWEATRRMGRGLAVQATVDSWRDAAGTVWTPNTLVPVDLPRATSPLVLSEVTFRRDSEGGTTAALVLVPKAALQVEPILLQRVPAEVKGPGQ